MFAHKELQATKNYSESEITRKLKICQFILGEDSSHFAPPC